MYFFKCVTISDEKYKLSVKRPLFRPMALIDYLLVTPAALIGSFTNLTKKLLFHVVMPDVISHIAEVGGLQGLDPGK